MTEACGRVVNWRKVRGTLGQLAPTPLAIQRGGLIAGLAPSFLMCSLPVCCGREDFIRDVRTKPQEGHHFIWSFRPTQLLGLEGLDEPNLARAVGLTLAKLPLCRLSLPFQAILSALLPCPTPLFTLSTLSKWSACCCHAQQCSFSPIQPGRKERQIASWQHVLVSCHRVENMFLNFCPSLSSRSKTFHDAGWGLGWVLALDKAKATVATSHSHFQTFSVLFFFFFFNFRHSWKETCPEHKIC